MTTKNTSGTKSEQKPEPDFKFKKIRAVTMPILKKIDNVKNYVEITGEIFTGKETQVTGKKEKLAPARLMPVIDLTTGEEMHMIANTVLESSLTESYPENGYINKQFEIIQLSVPNKRYKNYRITEIET